MSDHYPPGTGEHHIAARFGDGDDREPRSDRDCDECGNPLPLYASNDTCPRCRRNAVAARVERLETHPQGCSEWEEKMLAVPREARLLWIRLIRVLSVMASGKIRDEDDIKEFAPEEKALFRRHFPDRFFGEPKP